MLVRAEPAVEFGIGTLSVDVSELLALFAHLAPALLVIEPVSAALGRPYRTHSERVIRHIRISELDHARALTPARFGKPAHVHNLQPPRAPGVLALPN